MMKIKLSTKTFAWTDNSINSHFSIMSLWKTSSICSKGLATLFLICCEQSLNALLHPTTHPGVNFIKAKRWGLICQIRTFSYHKWHFIFMKFNKKNWRLKCQKAAFILKVSVFWYWVAIFSRIELKYRLDYTKTRIHWRVIMNGLTSGLRSNDLDYLSTDDRLKGTDSVVLFTFCGFWSQCPILWPEFFCTEWRNFKLILLPALPVSGWHCD